MNATEYITIVQGTHPTLFHLVKSVARCGYVAAVITEQNSLFAKRIENCLYRQSVRSICPRVPSIISATAMLDSVIREVSEKEPDLSIDLKMYQLKATLNALTDRYGKHIIIIEHADLLSSVDVKMLLQINEELKGYAPCGIILIGGDMLKRKIWEIRHEQKEKAEL